MSWVFYDAIAKGDWCTLGFYYTIRLVHYLDSQSGLPAYLLWEFHLSLLLNHSIVPCFPWLLVLLTFHTSDAFSPKRPRNTRRQTPQNLLP